MDEEFWFTTYESSQIETFNKKGRRSMGTGTDFTHKSGLIYILTCAHNLVRKDPDGKWVKSDDMYEY